MTSDSGLLFWATG